MTDYASVPDFSTCTNRNMFRWPNLNSTKWSNLKPNNTWTIMRLKSLLFTEQLHADWTVWDLIFGLSIQQLPIWVENKGRCRKVFSRITVVNLLIWMPRTEMGEQIVLLVEVKRTDKAFERPPVNIGK